MPTHHTTRNNPAFSPDFSGSFSYEEIYECFFPSLEIKTISETSEEENRNLLIIEKWWES